MFSSPFTDDVKGGVLNEDIFLIVIMAMFSAFLWYMVYKM